MKKILTILTLTIASVCVYSQTTDTINKFPVNGTESQRVVFVINNKDALLTELKQFDLKNTNLFTPSSTIAGEFNYLHVDENNIITQPKFRTVLQSFLRANWIKGGKTDFSWISKSNVMVVDWQGYMVYQSTDEEYNTSKENGWLIDGTEFKLSADKWAFWAYVKNDYEFIKNKVAEGAFDAKFIANRKFLRKVLGDEVYYNALNDCDELTDEQEKLKNRLFIKLYQKKMLGK